MINSEECVCACVFLYEWFMCTSFQVFEHMPAVAYDDQKSMSNGFLTSIDDTF